MLTAKIWTRIAGAQSHQLMGEHFVEGGQKLLRARQSRAGICGQRLPLGDRDWHA